MMKYYCLLSLALCLLPLSPLSAQQTPINYQVQNLDGHRWQYAHEVANIGLAEGIEEFPIWFDHGLYRDLQIETLGPPANNWDALVWQPDCIIKDHRAYDVWSLNLGIAPGKTVSGFTICFDWLGIGEPGSKYYEIIDPMAYNTIDSCCTVPEPATLFLLVRGGLAFR